MVCISKYKYCFQYYRFNIILLGKVVERPQHMLMRTAISIHGEDIHSAIETYNLLSEQYYIHATPTLYSAGSPASQLMSSHMITMPDDSIEGIYKCIRQCGSVSEYGGNISFSVQNIRVKGK